MYSEREINRIRDGARALGMNAVWRFWSLPGRDLARICNGYGPDNMRQALRNLLTWVYRNYPEAAAIHDVDYEYSDGSDIGHQEADKRFLTNLKIKLDYLYPLWAPWLYPVRAWAWAKIQLAYRAVAGDAGKRAWKEAHERAMANDRAR